MELSWMGPKIIVRNKTTRVTNWRHGKMDYLNKVIYFFAEGYTCTHGVSSPLWFLSLRKELPLFPDWPR
jgi:hypothetical protein